MPAAIEARLRVVHADDDRRHDLVFQHGTVRVLDVDVGVGEHARRPLERPRVVGKLDEEHLALLDAVVPLLQQPRRVQRVVDHHPQHAGRLDRQGQDVHPLVRQALADPVEGAGAVLQP